MPYYVYKKIDNRDEKGDKTGLFNGLLWYPTLNAPVTIFETRKEAQDAINDSKRVMKNAKFRIVDVEDVKDEG